MENINHLASQKTERENKEESLKRNAHKMCKFMLHNCGIYGVQKRTCNLQFITL